MFGSRLCSTNKIDFALNPMLLGSKFLKVVMPSDGSEFLAESPLAMIRALFYSGGMPMMAEFCGKMGMPGWCWPTAGDNRGTDHSKDSMCGKNARIYHFLQKNYHILRSDAQKSAKKKNWLQEYSRLFLKFYVRSYIRTFLSFRMYYQISTPPKIIFYRGRRIVGPGGPAKFAKQYYQNLQSNMTKIC